MGRRRFRWGDVWPVIKDWPAPRVRRLRLYCLDVMGRAPPDPMLRLMRVRVTHTFCMHDVHFRLAFHVKQGEWVLDLFTHDGGTPRRHPDAPMGRRARAKAAPARAARARPGRKATLKRILFVLCKIYPPSAGGAFSPLLARTVELMRAIRSQLVQVWHDGRAQARARFAQNALIIAIFNALAPQAGDGGARLEARSFGEIIGLPLVLNTFAPAPDWGAWLFGMPREIERARA